MANGSGGILPGFEYVIDRRDGMFCLLCRAADRSLLSRKDEPVRGIGICEPCSHQLAWAWRQITGEVPPGFPEADLRRVTTAYPRLSTASGLSDSSRREMLSMWTRSICRRCAMARLFRAERSSSRFPRPPARISAFIFFSPGLLNFEFDGGT